MTARDPATAVAPRTAEPLAVNAKAAAALLSIGLRTLRRLDSAGKLPAPVRIGGAVRWQRAELAAWLAAGSPDRPTWERLKSDR